MVALLVVFTILLLLPIIILIIPGAIASGFLNQILNAMSGGALDPFEAFLQGFGAGAAIQLAISMYVFAILPLVSTFLIIHGFLDNMRIFKNKITNLLLALAMAGATIFPLPGIPFPIIAILNHFIFGILAGWSVIIFAAMFFIGSTYYAIIKKRQWGTTAGVYAAYTTETKSLRREYAEMGDAIADLVHKLATETDPGKRSAIERSLQELHDRRNDIGERLKEMAEHMKSV